jgi:flagellar hook assembly protein FlgD
VEFQLPEPGRVSARAFTATGQLVRTLEDQVEFPAGPATLRWDGLDGSGRPVPRGIYFMALETSAGRSVRKISVVR